MGNLEFLLPVKTTVEGKCKLRRFPDVLTGRWSLVVLKWVVGCGSDFLQDRDSRPVESVR